MAAYSYFVGSESEQIALIGFSPPPVRPCKELPMINWETIIQSLIGQLSHAAGI